ncbi:MAG: dipeptide epimerase, partial [Maribacter sp.]|nr:dipeptide epimerase [Maribacter sp.]
IYEKGRAFGLPTCVLAALDVALWDQLAKTAKLPLNQLFGIPLPKVATSVTIGINPPEVVKDRIPILLQGTGIRFLKVKLGSKEGIEADKAMFAQVVESTAEHKVGLRVDANGGWDVTEAIHMMKWLANLGVDYVEQPLVHGREEDLPAIFKNRPLPIFVDESCCFSTDIPHWAGAVDGVNLKLMKCGGLTEALRIIATARAFGLKTMIGCMGESSLAISAAAALTGLLDHIDLDSQLNLDPDPFSGAQLINGIITPNNRPGHGAILKENM